LVLKSTPNEEDDIEDYSSFLKNLCLESYIFENIEEYKDNIENNSLSKYFSQPLIFLLTNAIEITIPRSNIIDHIGVIQTNFTTAEVKDISLLEVANFK
jgi:hypothetical protein